MGFELVSTHGDAYRQGHDYLSSTVSSLDQCSDWEGTGFAFAACDEQVRALAMMLRLPL